MYVCMYVYIYICVCVYVCMYVCMYVPDYLIRKKIIFCSNNVFINLRLLHKDMYTNSLINIKLLCIT